MSQPAAPPPAQAAPSLNTYETTLAVQREKPRPEMPDRAGNQPPQHLTVAMGPDAQHELPKGVGFQTGGLVERVEHHDGQTELHYKSGSHPQILSVDEKAEPGISDAIQHLKEGEQFGMKIGKDAQQHEVAEVIDKADGSDVKVHDDGVIEKGTAQIQPTRQLGRE
jgi:hypothetical protein